MFDANANGVDVGVRFFAEVYDVDTALSKMGVKPYDIVLCEHVPKTEKRGVLYPTAKIWRSLDTAPFLWTGKIKVNECSLLVYSGVTDGSGFISKKWRAKALDFLGGSWKTDVDLISEPIDNTTEIPIEVEEVRSPVGSSCARVKVINSDAITNFDPKGDFSLIEVDVYHCTGQLPYGEWLKKLDERDTPPRGACGAYFKKNKHLRVRKRRGNQFFPAFLTVR